MTQDEWRVLLEISVRDPAGDHWLTHLHLGLMHHARGESAAARQSWEESLRRRHSAWAYRNLAALSRSEGRHADALAHYAAAQRLLPNLRPLLVEYCQYLLERGLGAQALQLIDSASHELRSHSRVQFLEARAGLALRLPNRWQRVLSEDYELVDIREGESSLTDFWIELTEAGLNHDPRSIELEEKDWRVDFALPPPLDFRVAPSPHFKPRSAVEDWDNQSRVARSLQRRRSN
jgi:tetratricopeptide (TPR) repeat protein